jgi:hypothetical protein
MPMRAAVVFCLWLVACGPRPRPRAPPPVAGGHAPIPHPRSPPPRAARRGPRAQGTGAAGARAEGGGGGAVVVVVVGVFYFFNTLQSHAVPRATLRRPAVIL